MENNNNHVAHFNIEKSHGNLKLVQGIFVLGIGQYVKGYLTVSNIAFSRYASAFESPSH